METRYINLEIESLAAGGRGVARHEGKVVFVRGAFLGDRVRARMVRQRKNWGEAVVDDLLEASPSRTDPPCPVSGACGGCPWMPLSCESQLSAKETIVRDCIERIGKIPSPPVEPVIPCESNFGYRNKMEFFFAPEGPGTRVGKTWRAAPPALGLHAPGSYFRVVPMERCLLQDDASNRVLSVFRAAAVSSGKPAFNVRTGRGFWRRCIIRSVKAGREIMLYYITAQPSDRIDRAVVDAVVSQCPEVSTIIAGVSKSAASAASAPGSRRVIHGAGIIEEEIDGLRFRISPASFFQPNSNQAAVMLRTVAELAGPGGGKRACDLYTGGGAIAFFLAGAGYGVLGFDISADAVRDGQINARFNGVEGVVLRVADLAAPPVWAAAEPVDLVTADPPRAGVDPKAMEGIVRLSPPRVIMVSCNPATLARDLAGLVDAGYKLKTVRPIDMFPHTHHVETVALLEKKQSPGLPATHI